ncbi:MAG: hypothetical protein P1V97_29460 [Planctomycetota bacterium]|nr:hypothetical protein [Planctomycetota bacterium]
MKTLPIYLFSSLLLFMYVQPALAQDTVVEQKTKYTYSIESDIKMNVGTEKVTVGASTQIQYQNSVKAQTLSVTIFNFKVITIINGVENMNVEMARKGMTLKQLGKIREIPFDKSPKPQQELLKTFGKAFVKITLDGEGKESKRELANPSESAKTLEKEGLVANARLFHPEFSAKKAWKAKREIAMGNGTFISGELNYEKQDKPDANGHIVVKVSGTLTKKKMVNNGIEMVNIKYVVNGQELYDPKKKIWLSGDLKIAVTWDVKTPGGNGTAAGTMKLKLVPGK